MERCPSCSARLKDSVQCPRCKADLVLVLSAEKLAQVWCLRAIEFWQQQELQFAVLALKKSLDYQQTPLGRALRDFIIDQQCRKTVACLVKEDSVSAKQALQIIHCFSAQAPVIRQLQGFMQQLS